MNKKKVLLRPLQAEDREQFILDNQEAFRYGALEEFGCRDTHFEEDGEIISRDTIGKSIDTGEAYRIICDGQIAEWTAKRAILNYYLSLPRFTAKASAAPHDRKSRLCILR